MYDLIQDINLFNKKQTINTIKGVDISKMFIEEENSLTLLESSTLELGFYSYNVLDVYYILLFKNENNKTAIYRLEENIMILEYEFEDILYIYGYYFAYFDEHYIALSDGEYTDFYYARSFSDTPEIFKRIECKYPVLYSTISTLYLFSLTDVPDYGNISEVSLYTYDQNTTDWNLLQIIPTLLSSYAKIEVFNNDVYLLFSNSDDGLHDNPISVYKLGDNIFSYYQSLHCNYSKKFFKYIINDEVYLCLIGDHPSVFLNNYTSIYKYTPEGFFLITTINGNFSSGYNFKHLDNYYLVLSGEEGTKMFIFSNERYIEIVTFIDNKIDDLLIKEGINPLFITYNKDTTEFNKYSLIKYTPIYLKDIYQQPNIDNIDKLISKYPLEIDANDIIDNNSGIIIGDYITRTYRIGRTLELEDSYIVTSKGNIIKANESHSLCLYVVGSEKSTVIAGTHGILNSEEIAGGWGIGYAEDNELLEQIDIDKGLYEQEVRVPITLSYSLQRGITVNLYIEPNIPVFITYTYDGLYLSIYKDSHLKGKYRYSEGFKTGDISNSVLRIHKTFNYNNTDELSLNNIAVSYKLLSIYNKVLSEEEIISLNKEVII